MSAELPRPLKTTPFLIYALKKYQTKIQDKNYLFDMLWAVGNGMNFKSYPRYYELTAKKPPKQKQLPEKSSVEMVNDVVAKFKSDG